MKSLLYMTSFLILSVTSLDYWSWSPNYLQNGKDWVNLPQTQCNGLKQSPINFDNIPLIPPPQGAVDLELELEDKWIPNVFNYVNVVNMTAEISKLSFVNESGIRANYTARRVEIHAPGEHVIDGQLSDAEVHIVHQRDDTFGTNQPHYAIVAFSYKVFQNTESSFFKALNLELILGFTRINFVYAIGNDISSLENYYFYNGSLTFPPCAQNTSWFVFKERLPMSARQYGDLISNFADNLTFALGNGNNRDVQNLNGRSAYIQKYHNPHAGITRLMISLMTITFGFFSI